MFGSTTHIPVDESNPIQSYPFCGIQDYTQVLGRLEDYLLYPPQKGATEPCEIDNVSFELLSFPAVHSQS
jgi:hypothetical protein